MGLKLKKGAITYCRRKTSCFRTKNVGWGAVLISVAK